MSHITHFYHLAALDFVNASHLGHPFSPSVEATDMVGTVLTTTPTRDVLVGSYVTALAVRRKAHTMSALIGGRHPMQNAIVPGGVTTLVNHANGQNALTTFKALLDDVRNFINGVYLPNVLTAATAYGAGGIGLRNYWTYGTGCGNLLAYGDFDVDGSAAGNLLIKRGRAHLGTGTPTAFSVDQSRIVEYVGYSHYENFDILSGGAPSAGNFAHPWDGETKVSFEKSFTGGPSYSWMKAPRYRALGTELRLGGGAYAANDPIVYEVGPLARMAVTHYSAGQVSVNDDAPVNLGLGSYNCSALVTTALGLAGVGVANLFSVLGRHAARMLECKYLADAMADWVDQVIGSTGSPYTYIKLPKTLKKGAGLVEAPRGALGHWIKIEKKRVLKYQCIVPTTWNISPMDDTGQHGPAEEMVRRAGNLGAGANLQNQVIDILRLLHTYDFCSACAIHLTNADKKLVATIHMDTDGTTRVEYPE